MSTNYLTHVNCLECGHQMDYRPDLETCPACGAAWLDAQYDYQTVKTSWQNGPQGPMGSLWRYQALLPPIPDEFIFSMGEGNTPLIRARRLEKSLGHPAIFIKDERQMPTNSFKDRQGSVAISALAQRGITECALASTGNAAVAYAAYSAYAQIKLWVFLTSLVPAEKMREVALYGAEVVKVTGTYDEAKKVAADFAKRRQIHLDKGAKAIPGKESMKTMAFEIAEQLGFQYGPPSQRTPWRAPDWYVQAVSGGIGPLGVLKGFTELYHMGLTDRIPKIAVVQSQGCAPMVRSMALNQEEATPVTPKSRIVVLSTGDPGLAYKLLRKAQLDNGGAMISVSDEEAFAAMRSLASTQGISVEPATAVAFAGLNKLIEKNTITQNEVIVINCSGHTFPVEKHIMGDEMVLDMKLTQEAKEQEEELASALDHLDEQITSVLLVDDNPLDRLLVRRVLKSNKPYRVFEASGGAEGIATAQERQPDLIILDLNMPEVDGFQVLDALKANPTTAAIPVIVVSAKELTPTEKKRLEGRIASIWQKGSFNVDTLMSHLVKTINTSSDPGQAEANNVVNALHTIDRNTHKIVIVDDDPNDIRLLRRILESRRKYEIYEATNGTEALAIVQAQNPDLIISDLTMPDMDGFTLMETIKMDPDLEHIPIIFVSGKELSQEQRRQLPDGKISVLSKGKITVESLVSRVDENLS